MKRDKLTQATRRIKMRSPRWFWTRCRKCGSEYKQEPMWYFKAVARGPSAIRYTVWNCTDCCPTQAEVILKNEQYFGNIDVSPLRKEARYALEDEKLAAPLN